MSIARFRTEIQAAPYGKNDKKWFPRFLIRYAAGKTPTDQLLPVTKPLVLEFSRSLLKSGTPAWQRLQAVRAVEAYRDLVLQTSEPSLKEMKVVLGRLVAAEREAENATVQKEKEVIGVIDASEPEIVQTMRKELRLRRKALETERAYINWIFRFINHCGSEDLLPFGEKEIKSFLTNLAVEGNVAVSTQNQAKSALLFLYKDVLSRELGFLDVTSARKPKRLPVVLSRDEIAKIRPMFGGLRGLMFLVMYGAGLRHKAKTSPSGVGFTNAMLAEQGLLSLKSLWNERAPLRRTAYADPHVRWCAEGHRRRWPLPDFMRPLRTR